MLTVHEGAGMSADDAAWAMVADAAERALTLPGLSSDAASELRRLRAASLRCARLPSRRRPAAGQDEF